VPNWFERAIGFAVSGRGIELCRELGLYAARGILEFGFSPRHVSQHGVQPLWSQHHEAEHKHEQDFRSETHDSLLAHGLGAGNGGCCAGRLFFFGFHGGLEAADALSDTFA
jgi:hypothetical protein